MKGIVLAGDSGNRLFPLTIGIPKQLLPIYDEPMIYYPLKTIIKSGIRDILIITSVEHSALFKENLGDGTKFGASFSYACQNSPDGIAQAIIIAKDFIGKDSVCLITGDTIIDGDNFDEMLKTAFKAAEKSANATVFVDRDYDLNSIQYGRALFDEHRSFLTISGTSDDNRYYSIMGVYVFPNRVLKQIGKITLSKRNKLEIVSVIKLFHEDNKLQIRKISDNDLWFDTNSPDSILRCGNYMQTKREDNYYKSYNKMNRI